MPLIPFCRRKDLLRFSGRPANGHYERQRIRRRPGTVAIAAAIQQKYSIPVIPHVICSGATIEDIEYELIDMQFLGKAFHREVHELLLALLVGLEQILDDFLLRIERAQVFESH